MPEIMKKIRRDLGKDAVILNSKIVYTGGFLGLFRKKNFEVIAVSDNDPLYPKNRPADKQNVVKLEKYSSEYKSNLFHRKEKMDQELLDEIRELKQLMTDLPTANSGHLKLIPEPYKKVFNRLIQQQVDPKIREQLVEQILEHYYKTKKEVTDEDARRFIHHVLKEKIQQLPHGGMSLNKKFVCLIGPTGVGKTTTLAKIASRVMLNLHKKIAFITTDTYRIAAVEQLKTYAKILNVPVEVCYNSGDFKKALRKFENYDHVFIDTAGRNFRNQKYIEELRLMLDVNTNMETFLVFSLTAKEQDLSEIYRNFSALKVDKFIFTKLDETSQHGALFNLPVKYGKPVAYVSTGQNVPDDMIEANADFLIKQIIGEAQNERPS